MPKHAFAHVRRDDVVAVRVGKDRGKTGKVLRLLPKKDRIVVERVNIVKKHMRPSQTQAGGIVERESPIHISNVLLFCPKCGRGVRTRIRSLEDGGKVRLCVKCGEALDK